MQTHIKHIYAIISLYDSLTLVFTACAYMFLPQRARRSTRPRARSFRPSSTLTALGPVRTSSASATPPPRQCTATQVVQCASPPAAPVQSRTAHRGRTCRERRERGRGRAVGVVAVVVAGVAVDVLVLVVGVVAVDAARLAALVDDQLLARSRVVQSSSCANYWMLVQVLNN